MKKLHVRQYGNQYSYGTTVKDRNGVEIFEGDRVVFEPAEEDKEDGWEPEYGFVVWDKGRFMIIWDGSTLLDPVDETLTNMVKVVGSKYEPQTA